MDSQFPRRGSTSQMCLHKILTIITTVPPPVAASESSAEEDAWGLSSSGGSAAGCFDVNRGNGGDRVDCKEDGDRASENSHIEIEGAERRSMILLIEAAKLIFGEFIDDDNHEKLEADKEEIEPNERELGRRNSCWVAAEEAPVVRSRRGRLQVLPGKFRDSVLEPLSRFSRTRSSTLPSKRGPR